MFSPDENYEFKLLIRIILKDYSVLYFLLNLIYDFPWYHLSLEIHSLDNWSDNWTDCLWGRESELTSDPGPRPRAARVLEPVSLGQERLEAGDHQGVAVKPGQHLHSQCQCWGYWWAIYWRLWFHFIADIGRQIFLFYIEQNMDLPCTESCSTHATYRRSPVKDS